MEQKSVQVRAAFFKKESFIADLSTKNILHVMYNYRVFHILWVDSKPLFVRPQNMENIQ